MGARKLFVLVVALLASAQLSAASETVLLDFGATWCGPCRMMKPTVERLAAAGYPVREVDIDSNRDLASKYNVTGVPCFVMLSEGEEIGRVVGHTSYGELERLIKKGMSHGSPAADPVGNPRAGRAPLASIPLMETAAPHKAAPSQSNESSVSDELLLSVTVRLRIEHDNVNDYGTGTIIDRRGEEALVLTCGHIFRDSKGEGTISVEMFDRGEPEKFEGRLVTYNLDRDVALVVFRPAREVNSARVAPGGYQTTPGAVVASVGCDHGDPPTVRRSRITAVDKYQGPPNVEVAGTPVQGRSGGGLFDADGRVIGVCNASDPRDNEGIFAALASVHEELVSAGLAAVFNAPAENAIVSATSTRTPSRRQPPPMPENMPRTLPVQPDGPLETSLQGLANSESNDSGMTPAEIATLKELVGRAGSAEVICIIRPHHPDGQSEIVVLDEASPEFVRKLAEIQGRTERR